MYGVNNAPRAFLIIHSHHPLVHLVLSRILVSYPDWHVVDAPPPAYTGESTSPVLMIIDACSTVSWPALIRREKWNNCRKIVLQPAQMQNVAEELRVLLLGISGIVYVSNSLEQELPRAIEAVLGGKFWVSRRVLAEYVKRTCNRQVAPASGLTLREEQIYALLARGLANRKIGAVLGISERTVKFHVSNILRKRQASSRKILQLDSTSDSTAAADLHGLAKVS